MADLLDIPIGQNSPGSDTPVNPIPAASSTNSPTTSPALSSSSAPASSPNKSASTPAPTNIPSIAEMEAKLQQSGNLLTEVAVNKPNNDDKSPLSDLQPKNLAQTPNGPQLVTLAESGHDAMNGPKFTLPDNPTTFWHENKKTIKHIIKVGIAAVLILEGLRGIYEAMSFILLEYPQLEVQLLAHQITQDEVNEFAAKALITLITTVINLFFAMHVVRSKTLKTFHTVFGIVLLLMSTYLNNYLISHYDVAQWISGPLTGFLNLLNMGTKSAVKSVPFVEQTNTGDVNVVWYQ